MDSNDDFYFEFHSALDSLAACRHELSNVLAPFQKLKTWNSQDKQSLLQTLAQFMFSPELALQVAKHFKPVILEILQKSHSILTGTKKEQYTDNHEKLSFNLSTLLPIMPCTGNFILQYFKDSPLFFLRLNNESNASLGNDIVLMIVRTAYNLLHCDLDTFSDAWNWSPFFTLMNHRHTEIRWLALHIVVMVTRMSECRKVVLIDKLFTTEEANKLKLKMHNEGNNIHQTDMLDSNSNEQTKVLNAIRDVMDTDSVHLTGACFTKDDLTGNYTAVCGIILPSLENKSHNNAFSSLIMVPSTTRNLHSLSLAVAAGCGVLLEGPVGSGKTTLVEYLAAITGRTAPPHLMKVQLGDQTDSKSLLGTYVCTDTPGEFVWQPGTILQAVTGGHWVLLEDIDYAPMDVISILIPLLESRMLSVPGHGNVVKAVPGFQLFATQRTSTSSGSTYHIHTNSSMLDRLWTRVNVEPLTKQELTQVLSNTFPDLDSIAAKLVDIYCMLSSDSSLVSNPDTSYTFLPHNKRLSTTRDLMKWARRVSMVTGSVPLMSEARDVFMEAQDCFGATLSKAELRLEQGIAVGAKLGLTKQKVEFFCKNYKPKVHVSPLSLTVGRVTLNRDQRDSYISVQPTTRFAHTRHSLVLLERVAACVWQHEPALLVGETGTGKTCSVQNLAVQCGYNLKVINMSQQSDSADLLGGFKPVEMKQLVSPVRESFEVLFCQTFSRKQNVRFLSHVQQCYTKGQWEVMFKLMLHSQQAALDRIAKGKGIVDNDVSSTVILTNWHKLCHKIQHLKKQQKHAESTLAFRFVEGALVTAVCEGDWVLLDEINLATPETLECLSGLLESSAGSVVLLERGDVDPIIRHDDFRLFACMNPATDVGKKDLPPGIRNRFTEIFVEELEDVVDLKILVVDYLQGLSPSAAVVDGIVRFYLNVRYEASKKLTDGTGHKPHYSLRTLCRAVRYASSNPHGNALRSIYEGFCLSFLTQLDRSSHPVVVSMIRTHILGHVNATSLLNQPLPRPRDAERDFVNFEGFWVAVGECERVVPVHYVLTSTVKENLRDLARVVSGRTFPVLIQGETSVGKTSLVQWLASASGNRCVRINNHEHTDIQEYLGCYTSDRNGRLVFKEGVLVDAMRKGYWIILDELNLAPTDVLEALNRVLDDNRELFIPETQQTVKAHPKFMLFATQNPPGQYGGRKILSRAFRNRFVELHFDELPSKELETILHQRGSLPMSYAKRLVAVLLDLQARRRSSSVFAGKQGFITLRDLFRWAERYSKTPDVHGGFHDWEQYLADDGYMLLAGRCRHPEECKVIKEVLQLHFKRMIDTDALFGNTLLSSNTPLSTRSILEQVSGQSVDGFGHVVWTQSMRRLSVLAGRALQFGEPVLLVGETGCGKTTICQLFAALKQQTLYSVNCHMHSESSDFLGGLRPVRHTTQEREDGKLQRLFEWSDGPLVLAMKDGAMLLVDEISLADDSVLERLNSVLEPERTLVLAEKGSDGDGIKDSDVDVIVAHDKFRVIATMNPGGDFGKKELSPALRNRFTEIWCPSTNSRQDLIEIIEHNLTQGITLRYTDDGKSGIGEAMMDFIEWFHATDFGKRFIFSIRDLLSWISFINMCCCEPRSDVNTTEHVHDNMVDHRTVDQPACLDTSFSHQPIRVTLNPSTAYVHGACLVFLDALGAGLSSFASSAISPQAARQLCLDFLGKQIVNQEHVIDGSAAVFSRNMFGIEPFFIARGPLSLPDNFAASYALNAPTTSQNAQRVLRALQLSRPILLEGSPGVGKTSLVTAIAKASGHELVRINLSEQTDITDLFGADLPVEGGEPGQFSWRDGPLLGALKAGHWIVLDELNLASQSVLEGLNACLDHRAEVYIPELGTTFKVQHEKTRLFACQNPLHQGGGRKGLPKSFLNRFTQVYVEPLSMEDLQFITQSMYSQIDGQVLHNMIKFNMRLHRETVVEATWGRKGSPWEFNLRDVLRWCDLLLAHQASGKWNPCQFVKLIYSDRMRTNEDKKMVLKLFQDVFGISEAELCDAVNRRPFVHITPTHVQVGHSFFPRCPSTSQSVCRPLQVLHHDLPYMESLMKCLEMNWMAILIGPRSCGKTSLIQMVAELTGNKLDVMAMNSAMDTTELLGGFEQVDLSRHWEGLVSDAKDAVLGTIRDLLLRKIGNGAHTGSNSPGSLDEVVHLYRTWCAFVRICSTDSREERNENSENSPGLTTLRIEALLHILEMVLHMRTQHDLHLTDTDKITVAVLALKTRYEANRCSTHCGGQFEWVDGQLVEALKSGHWLLIDNVNFCSPSVLDRLNALLEPGGVLSINERGVIDGDVPSVKPHPYFRLILNMDPRFGEISRAMRNRGVEIYIQGEDDEMGYDSYDIHAMTCGTGLVDTQTCQMLMAFHKIYKENLGGSILDLLRASSMITDLVQRGFHTQTAVSTAMNQVYVRSHVNERDRQTAEELIRLHTSHLRPSNNKGAETSVLLTYPVPLVNDFSDDSTLCTIRWHCIPLLQLLCRGSPPTQLEHAVSILMERSSLCDWRLRCDVMAAFLSQTRSATEAEQQQVSQLSAMTSSTVRSIFTSRLMDQLRLVFHQLGDLGCDYRQLCHQPYDIRLNVQLSQRLDMQCSETGQHLHMMETLVNRLYLLGARARQTFLQDDRVEDEHPVTRKKRTLIKLSRDFHFGILSALPHPTVAHLFPFFKLFGTFVEHLNLLDCTLSNEQLSQTLDALVWSDRLWKVCVSPHTSSFSLSSLSLHWQWFMENTLSVLPQLLGHLNENDVPSDLVTVVRQLSNHLGSDNRLAQTHMQILNEYGHPTPFKALHLYQYWEKLDGLCQMLEMKCRQEVTPHQKQKLSNQLNLLMAEGPTVKGILVEAMAYILSAKHEVHDGRCVDLGALDQLVDTFNSTVSTYGLEPKPSNAVFIEAVEQREYDAQSRVSVSKENITKAVLLPLFHNLSSCQELCVIAHVMKYLMELKCERSMTVHTKQEISTILEVFCNYALCNTTRRPSIVACYRVLAAVFKEERDPSSAIKSLESDLMHSSMMSMSDSLSSANVADWIVSFSEDLKSSDGQTQTMTDIVHGNDDAYSFNILTNVDLEEVASTKNQDDTPEDPLSSVTIGNYREKHQQLLAVSQHFWSNADMIDNRREYSRSNSVKLFASKFSQVLLSMVVLVDEDSVKEKITSVAKAVLSSSELCTEQMRDLEFVTSQVCHAYGQLCGDERTANTIKTLVLESFGHLKAYALGSREEDTEKEVSIEHGCMWIKLGLLQTILLAPVGPVDPVEQNAIELQYAREEIADIKQELHVRFCAEEIWTGTTISVQELEHDLEHQLQNDDVSSVRHLTSNPVRTSQLIHKWRQTKRHEMVLAQHTALRPSYSQYDAILDSVNHYSSTVGSPESVLELLKSLQDLALSMSILCDETRDGHTTKVNVNGVKNALHRAQTWKASQKQFISHMNEDFALYSDIITPFVSAAAQVLYGMTIASRSLQWLLQRQRFLLKSPAPGPSQAWLPGQLIEALCRHPSIQERLGTTTLEFDSAMDCIQAMFNMTDTPLANEAKSHLQSYFSSRLLWASLLHVRNRVTQCGYLNGRAHNAILSVLNNYHQQWMLAKEEEQRKEQEEDNIFKFKAINHGEQRSEHQQTERALCEAFPSYDDEFSDVMPSISLEEVKVKPSDDVTTVSDVQAFMGKVNICGITQMHELLFSKLPNQRLIVLQGRQVEDGVHRNVESNHLEVLQVGYQVAAVVSSVCTEGKGPVPLGTNWQSHLLQSHSVQQRLGVSTINEEKHGDLPLLIRESGKHYDIYHDANIPEVIRTRSVLEAFTARLNELLTEWPGNPILTQLQLFVERILTLPVTCPVMKVLTGVELLLKNAQEWESNASRHVSIKNHLDALTQLIISWRKLELRCWSSLLDVATDKVAEKASHWWFYLYSLLQQAEGDRVQHIDSDGSGGVPALIEPLQRFIESSSLGEFSARMRMLYSFYRQYVSTEGMVEYQSDLDAKVSNVLSNVFMYYKQFTCAIEQSLLQAREPIEKELKGYVKIAKWNDANFWAMKQAAEKSHRTLHKFVSRYEMALGEPVRKLLMDTKTVLGSLEEENQKVPSVGKMEASWFVVPGDIKVHLQTGISGMDLSSAFSLIQTPSLTHQLERFPKLFSRMRKLCQKMLIQQKYPQLVTSLDEFTGEIIESVHELQALDIANQPKEKHAKSRKHIHIRKRKALSELFKVLATIGLSYRKGLNAARQSLVEDSAMLLPALDESIACKEYEDSALAQTVRQLFSGCQHYYHRCLARTAALTVTITTPSKELTVGDVDRCKGYTHHLLRVVQSQRRTTATVTHNLTLLRLAMKSFTGIADVVSDSSPRGLPPQRELQHRMVELMDFLTWASEVLLHSSLLMKCCPHQEYIQECSPLPPSMLSEAAKSSSDSSVMLNIRKDVEYCLSKVQELADFVRPHAAAFTSHMTGSDTEGSYILASWDHFKILLQSFSGLKDVGQTVGEMLPHFSSCFTPNTGLGSTFFVLKQKLEETCENFDTWNRIVYKETSYGSQGVDSLRSLSAMVEKTVTMLLLGVQRITKAAEPQHEAGGEESEDNGGQSEEKHPEAEYDDLLDGHLVTHIHSNLMDEISKLDLTKVKTTVASLMTSLRDAADSRSTSLVSSEEHSVLQPSEGNIPSTVSISLVASLVPLLRQYLAFSECYLVNLLSANRTSCKLLSVLLGLFTELAAKGFCLPPEIEEEESGEGATEFEDIEGGGLGEGEGAKDVSDQIESEDQLQDAKQEGQKEDKEDNAQQQIPDEENAIEMSEDFDGALHDVEADEGDDNESEDGEDKEPDLDKQMGEVDGQEDETLDEKMWGDSDDEDEDKESKEEKGAGAEAESESQVVAKEDNKDAVDQSKEREQDAGKQDDIHELPKDEDQGNLPDEEQRPQEEFNESDATPGAEETENLDLPEDLQLDDVEVPGDETGEEDEQMEWDEEKEGMDVDKDNEEVEFPEDDKQEGGGHDNEMEGEDVTNDDEGKQEGQDEEGEDVSPEEDEDWKTKHESESQDAVQAVEDQGKNTGAQNQNEAIEKADGQSEPADNQDQQGVGAAEAAGSEGHLGEDDGTTAQSVQDARQKSQQRKQMNRSRTDRSLGSVQERTHKRLKTVDETESAPPRDVTKTSDLYQHMHEEDKSSHDTQTLDSATVDQAKKQDSAAFPEQISDNENDNEVEERLASLKEKEERPESSAQQHKRHHPPADTEMKVQEDDNMEEKGNEQGYELNDDRLSTDRTRSTYHVSEAALSVERQDLPIDADKLRSDLEHQLSVWSNFDHGTTDEQKIAQEAWHKYELLTSGLAQELCEQLRLVLEPSLATKLRGDYRTGKRLNMRKVIPYIASQFRKDKIWLRRTKPSKRQYQIMLAVDDSSSMADNHSKQLAFESLALISKALTRLEAGDLAVCSFGESVQLLHPLHEPFTDQSGAKILQHFTFDQKKTKIAQLVGTCTSLMLSSRSRLQAGPRMNISQLLLIVSDGRGVFLEGVETVLRTVREAKEVGIFLVFVILDNPVNRDSVLDIKVPIFHPGKLPEIKSYMEQFPFPFYIILRDINALPVTLSDALRQWFELVTSME